MIYQPDEDPYLMNDDGSVASGPSSVHSRNDNYQYQPQSMYQIPVGPPLGQPAPYPQNYPPNAQPRRLRPKPSMYAPNGVPLPPPGPTLRAAPSFYGDPMMGPPVVGQPMVGQPYIVPAQAQPYGYVQPVPMQAPVFVPNGGGYRDVRGNILNDQIDEFNRYHSSRPRNNNSEESSLLIATLVSEQDAMYGTNMLENITPADLEYIQSLMSRGAPEHEAYRMAFERKPHTVRPPKVVGETFADKKALEDAIQASLTESSRRACRPDTTPNDRADQEALEKAIQLSLLESTSHYSGQTTSNNTQSSYAQASSQPTSSYRADEQSYSGSEYYSEADENRRLPSGPDTRPFDRQYPYNLSAERPIETLSRPKPVNLMTEEDYTRARLLREAEEIRARAYGGSAGSVTSGTSEYSRPYPPHHQQYRNDGGEDDYTVDSRNSRGSQGSRSMDSRSQYSYDRHPQHGHPHGHGHGHQHVHGHNHGQHGQYAQNDRTTYTSSSHTAVHRSMPAPHNAHPYPVSQPYPAPQVAANYYGDSSPAQYRVEEADYDSQSYSNSEEGKDDFDHRQDFVQQGKKHSRSSNYTSTSSISAADEGDYTPRSNEEQYRSNYNQYNNNGPGGSPYRPGSPPSNSSGERAQYPSNYARAPAMPPPGANLQRSASPAINSANNGQLPRVPSFITPRSTQSASPVPGAGPGVGGPVPSLARVPSFITPRPPVPPAAAQVTPRVGIAGEVEASAASATASANANVSSTTSVDGSVVSAPDPSLPQFERRKTLMRLVSKLTVDSDED